MNPVTHLLIGWTAANCVRSATRKDRAVITIASILPDIDGIGIIAEKLTENGPRPMLWYQDYHHVLAHNIFFGLFMSAIALAISRRMAIGPAVLAVFHLHLLGDIIGSRGPDGYQWPVPYLYPVSDLQLQWAGQWELTAWPNLVLTVVLEIVMVMLAWRRGFSPVEIISPKLDAKLISMLRRVMPKAA